MGWAYSRSIFGADAIDPRVIRSILVCGSGHLVQADRACSSVAVDVISLLQYVNQTFLPLNEQYADSFIILKCSCGEIHQFAEENDYRQDRRFVNQIDQVHTQRPLDCQEVLRLLLVVCFVHSFPSRTDK